MSIAVDRVQNYYQFQDAESKFYQLLKSEDTQEVEQVVQAPAEPAAQDSKSKKSKKNKKKDSVPVENVSAPVEPAQEVKRKATKSVSKEDIKDEDVSVKTDSGIVDEQASESAAAKKKSKSKKQREKKAAAAAALAQQQQESPEIPQSPKEPQVKERIVIDLTPAAAAATTAPIAKPKDKKKKPKNPSAEQKTKEDNDKNGVSSTSSNLVSEIAKARQHIKSSLERVDGASALSGPGVELFDRIASLEKDNSQLHGVVDGLQKLVISLEGRLNKLEGGSAKTQAKPTPAPSKPAPADDDDDVDLFGSDEEDDEAAEKLKADRVKAYTDKKSKKPALIAKSSILMDVKPWDDETDMAELEKCVRSVTMDGHLWGASKLVPLAYGIKKLQICCVIEDEKVSVDELQEKIQEFEDFVQSVDIAAFNKI